MQLTGLLDTQIHQLELQLEQFEMQTAAAPQLSAPTIEDKTTSRRPASEPEQLLREELRVH